MSSEGLSYRCFDGANWQGVHISHTGYVEFINSEEAPALSGISISDLSWRQLGHLLHACEEFGRPY